MTVQSWQVRITEWLMGCMFSCVPGSVKRYFRWGRSQTRYFMTRYGNKPFCIISDLHLKARYSFGPVTTCFSISACWHQWAVKGDSSQQVLLEGGWFISMFWQIIKSNVKGTCLQNCGDGNGMQECLLSIFSSLFVPQSCVVQLCWHLGEPTLNWLNPLSCLGLNNLQKWMSIQLKDSKFS